MSEILLGSGYLSYIREHLSPPLSDNRIRHWTDLLTQRTPLIQQAKELLAALQTTPPYFSCRTNKLPGKVDFDFGPKSPEDLVVVLYKAVLLNYIAYDCVGSLVIAKIGQEIIPPPFIWMNRGHYLLELNKVVRLTPGHPASRLHELTTQVIDPVGLSFAEDSVFLLGQITNEQTPNINLLKFLGIKAV